MPIMTHDTSSLFSEMPSPPPSPLIAKPAGLPCSVTDLSKQMNEHSLDNRRKRPITPALTTPPNELSQSPTWSVFSTTSPFGSPAFSDLSSEPSILESEPPRRARSPPLPYSNYHNSNVRRSRQDAIRAQCTSTHLHEISLLVARMVDSGEQCIVCAPEDMTSRSQQHLTEESAQMESDMDLDMSEDENENDDRPQSSHSKSARTTPSTSRRASAVGSGGGKDSHFCVSKQRPGLATRRRTTTLNRKRTS